MMLPGGDDEMWRGLVLLLPEHMRDAVKMWIEWGEPHPRMMGSFFRAVLMSDLAEAAARADMLNAGHLLFWGRLLLAMPIGSWGSDDALLEWHRARRPAVGR